jgi:hypothetical protein
VVTSQIKVVYLSSPGGEFVTSLKIARLVRAWKLETVVGYYAQCASGCAIVWFAGDPRRIMQGGRIGLHAASTKTEGRRTRSDRGTAVMVKFLRLLGAPEAVLQLVEATAPESMHWINRVEAGAMGLSTPVVESSSTPVVESSSTPVVESSSTPAVESSSTPAVESSSPPPGVRRSPAWLWDAQRGYSRQRTIEEE